MPPSLLPHQRELLRAFRHADAERAQAEADAEARRKAACESTDAALTRATQSTEAQLAEARKASESGQSILAQANLKNLREQARVVPPAPRPGADPSQELNRSVSIATDAPARIEASVEALQRWRTMSAARRGFMFAFSAIAILVCTVTGISGYQAWRAELLYRSAVSALEAGQWETARSELEKLKTIKRDYKDTLTLLHESYYRPAVWALEAGQWNAAADEIYALQMLDANYRDLTDLPAIYPQLLPALATRYGELWSKDPVVERQTLNTGSNVNPVAFSPDGQLLALGGWDEVELWSVASGQRVFTLKVDGRGVSSVAFSPDARILASGNGGSNVILWGVSSRAEIRTLETDNTVNSVAFSPDGRLLASTGVTVSLWDVDTGQEVHKFSDGYHGYRVESVAFSPDGRILASDNGGGNVILWDVSSGQEVRTLSGHDGFVTSVAFSPDGRLLASASTNAVNLWNVDTGKEVRFLGGGGITSVAFSPDGRLLATAGYGNAVKLWDVANRREVQTLGGQDGSSVAFSPDGRLLASGYSTTTTLWIAKEP